MASVRSLTDGAVEGAVMAMGPGAGCDVAQPEMPIIRIRKPRAEERPEAGWRMCG